MKAAVLPPCNMAQEIADALGLTGVFVDELHLHFPSEGVVEADVHIVPKGDPAAAVRAILKRYALIEILDKPTLNEGDAQ